MSMKVNELVKGHYYILKVDNLVHVFQFEKSNSAYPDRYFVVHYPVIFTIDSHNFMRCEKESTKVFDVINDEFEEIDESTFLKMVKMYEMFYSSIKLLMQKYLK